MEDKFTIVFMQIIVLISKTCLNIIHHMPKALEQMNSFFLIQQDMQMK